ncbi:MAG: ATP-binding protein [Rhodothermales bacterium]
MSPYERRLQEAISDSDRLKMLDKTQLLDSPSEEAFDRITNLATRLIGAPISLVSLVADDRQFFKSTNGLPEPLADLRTTPLSHSFCQHVVATSEAVVADDTRTHELVNEVQSIQDFGILSYLGIPLKTSCNQTLGTLCVLDYEPRPWESKEVHTLQDLASIAMTEVALRLELQEQVALQAVIKESENRYRSVVEGIHDVVFKLDASGRVAFVNPAWKTVLGYELNQTIGRHINEFLPRDEIYGQPVEALRAHAASQTAYTTHFISKTGAMRWLEMRIKQQGEYTLTGVITDVTDSYRVEAEHEARIEAERHLRLKDALLSNMSHEVRTPLTAIMSCSALLQEEVEPDQKEFVDMIHQGGERLLSTLDTMLLFAQAQSGNITLNTSTFDLAQEIERIVHVFGPQHIRVTLDVPKSVMITSDQSLIETILRRIIGNAFKYTKKGEITIRLKASTEECVIEVIDTGIGIPAGYMPNLFTPFEQAYTGNTRSHEGSGLGLALAKVLIDLLHGKITAESEENEGSHFLISLPQSIMVA